MGGNDGALAPVLVEWAMAWRQQLQEEGRSLQAACELMARCNPQCIPRNHHVERVLAECESSGETRPIDDFLEVLRSPYTDCPSRRSIRIRPGMAIAIIAPFAVRECAGSIGSSVDTFYRDRPSVRLFVVAYAPQETNGNTDVSIARSGNLS